MPTIAQQVHGPNPKVLILTDGALTALSGRADVLRDFPFFRMPKSAGRTCCRKRAAQGEVTGRQRAVREALVRLPKDRQEALKRLLGVGQLVLFVRGPRGVEQHTL